MIYFAAYPSSPEHISYTIEQAEKEHLQNIQIKTWRSTFNAGKLIDQLVLPEIKKSDGLICDVTIPNENVFFEIGYAIGLRKPIIPIVNETLNGSDNYLRKLGLLDNVGQIRYENVVDLVSKLNKHTPQDSLFAEPNFLISQQPLLILESLRKNELSVKLISAVKEFAKFYRTFDPQEEYRLSLRNAWELVNESSAIIVTILDSDREDYQLHNIRAAFLAGLAIATNKECLILVEYNAKKPLDYIDICKTIKHPEEIKDAVQSLVPVLYKRQLSSEKKSNPKQKNLLSTISVGSNAAENEMRELENYFIETHDFKNALEGRGRLVVGRKGAGKTAIFWRVRDIVRKQSSSELVIDLKPDGYQLRKFKEQLVSLLEEGTKEHTLTAFWEYVIYCEIIYKIFENDFHQFYGRNPGLTKLFDELSDLKKKSLKPEKVIFQNV